MPSNVFHDGELLAQQKAGTTGTARNLGQYIATEIEPYGCASAIISSAPLLFLSHVSASGTLWVSAVFGRPGSAAAFPHRVTISTSSIHPQDALLDAAPGTPIGLLAIDLERRARYRANGVSVASTTNGLFCFQVLESFPNCPKYIRRRRLLVSPGATPMRAVATVEVRHELNLNGLRLVAKADTLFLGTAQSVSVSLGADVNHRGAKPGFVLALSGTELVWSDFRGNGMLQSAKLEVNHIAGLTFLDFETGDVLQISGSAVVDWNAVGIFDGAPRVMRFTVAEVRNTKAITDYRWALDELSPYNPTLVDTSNCLRFGRT
jgi:uncharacterized protein